jgi:hypothetical protein
LESTFTGGRARRRVADLEVAWRLSRLLVWLSPARLALLTFLPAPAFPPPLRSATALASRRVGDRQLVAVRDEMMAAP